jgi:hypothetical protein
MALSSMQGRRQAGVLCWATYWCGGLRAERVANLVQPLPSLSVYYLWVSSDCSPRWYATEERCAASALCFAGKGCHCALLTACTEAADIKLRSGCARLLDETRMLFDLGSLMQSVRSGAK